MSAYSYALLWAMAMVVIALSTRLGIIGDGAADTLLIAALAGWVATTPRSVRCRFWSAKP